MAPIVHIIRCIMYNNSRPFSVTAVWGGHIWWPRQRVLHQCGVTLPPGPSRVWGTAWRTVPSLSQVTRLYLWRWQKYLDIKNVALQTKIITKLKCFYWMNYNFERTQKKAEIFSMHQMARVVSFNSTSSLMSDSKLQLAWPNVQNMSMCLFSPTPRQLLLVSHRRAVTIDLRSVRPSDTLSGPCLQYYAT